jgi:integrase
MHFVTREVIEKVLAECPDAQWRLIVALSRFGGLRCPSEHLGLRWCDVKEERDRMVIRSPKTEHHEGGGEREVPLFPELVTAFAHVWKEVPAGTRLTTPVITRYRPGNANLRTQFERIIERAGVTPWPRLFHNLRSSRQTELAEKWPGHVVSAWLGNSEQVARDHYLQVLDDHFAAAAADGEGVEESAEARAQSVRQAAAGGCSRSGQKRNARETRAFS